MRFHAFLTASILAFAFATSHAFAETNKQKKQAELRKATAAALQDFYKAQPNLQADVAKAPGYAVFTTYGLSFIVGGEGGKGHASGGATFGQSRYYTLTSAGLPAGGALEGTKFWKDKGLN